MPLIQNSYGKGRVRVMRVHRVGERYEVRELTVQTMLEGNFAAAYTAADNREVIATDTIKNITYIVAGEAPAASAEVFAQRLGARFLERYPQVTSATVTTHETSWLRASFGGKPHAHSFVLDGNGTPYAKVGSTRGAAAITSGIVGYTFMKATQSGWVGYVQDEYTPLPETEDRLTATAMDATWTWRSPADYPATNAVILQTMLEVFATTYSHSVQDSLLRMGEAALSAVPELDQITLACPNKHYLPVDLERFGSRSGGVLVPTDEPHGQIECVVGRG
jgi:urate oxidase